MRFRSMTAAPTRSSFTRCCITPTRPPRRSPRRRGCSAPGGRLLVVDFAAHEREELARRPTRISAWALRMRPWPAGSRRRGLFVDHVEHLEGRRADRDLVARREGGRPAPAEGRMNRHRPASCQPRRLCSPKRAATFSVSFEFFPPKTDKMAETLWESVQTLAPLQPRFVSVTYGAGGSTRERTHQTVERILKETSLTPAAHLTCVGRQPRRDRRDRPRLLGPWRAQHRRASRRSARGRHQVPAASRKAIATPPSWSRA